MKNNFMSKLVLLVPIFCQNWQFWGPNCIANKKIGNFFAKILKFCPIESRIGQKFEYFGQKNAKLAIITPILAPKLPFFIIRSLFANKFNLYSLFANNENPNKMRSLIV